MDTAALVRAFEDGTLRNSDFHHAEHVRVTWFYLERYGYDEALRRLADGLLRFATRAGRADKFDDSLTRAWVEAIDRARRAHPAARSFDALVHECPELLDRSTIRASV
jgi:hypothetical protein